MQGTILSNRYLITAEISMGGMGMVYRATDLRTGGEVAVKVPHAFLARNPEYMERLRREAQIAASIYSPRVVRVIDLDTHEGTPYIVMEYVPGETLADEIRQRGRLTLGETLTVGLEVARALDAAHAKGIVHRDLKPQNIKLVEGEVKVLDFGISKGEGFAAVTAASVFMGTPEYCAPERAAGEGDIRSDIYALGVILYELHEGRLPFQAPTPLALLRQHETEPPPPLSGEVPAAFGAIVARCLAKDPADRFPTPRELVQALRVLLDSPSGNISVAALPDGLTPTLAQPRPTDPATPAEAMSTTNASAQTETGPGESLSARGFAAAPAAPASTAPRVPRRSLIAIAGIIAAIVIGMAVTAVVLTGRESEGASSTDETAGVSNGSPAAGTAPPGRALLLTPGQSKPLMGMRIEFPVINPNCPGLKVIFQPTAISAEPSGRVAVSYFVEMPRVAGVECVANLSSDANCECLVLQTRLASGRVVEARNTGGSGAANGAEDLYGTRLMGAWWWDRGVELDGEELTLLRLNPGETVPLFRLALLRR